MSGWTEPMLRRVLSRGRIHGFGSQPKVCSQELCGLWKRMGAGNHRRGCIRRIATHDGRDLTGIWVNSNKTADRGVLFDDAAGYEIPWRHEDVLRNLAAMREWQERYNTVAGPLPHAALAPNLFGDEPSEAVRALIPDRFYLVRYPPNPGLRGAEMPPSYQVYMQFFTTRWRNWNGASSRKTRSARSA